MSWILLELKISIEKLSLKEVIQILRSVFGYKKYVFKTFTIIVAHELNVRNWALTDILWLNTPCAIEFLFTYLIEIAVYVNDKCDIENAQNTKQCLWLKKILRRLMGNIFTPGILWTISSVTENKSSFLIV